MKYSVIRIKNKQYKVSEGDEILVDRLTDKKIEPEVLLFADSKSFQLGEPVLKKAKVKISVLGEEMGKKIHVQKFAAKSRYRKKIGFRPKFTRLKIDKIGSL